MLKGRLALHLLAVLTAVGLAACGGSGGTSSGGGGGTVGGGGIGVKPAVTPGGGSSSNTTLGGGVFGGATPITGSIVTLYQSGNTTGGAATSLGSATTDSSGNFSISFTNPGGPSVLYLISVGGNAGAGANSQIELAEILGTADEVGNLVTNLTANGTSLRLNEVSSVVAAYTMHYFIQASSNHSISGPSPSLPNAAATALNLIDPTTGLVQSGLDTASQGLINGLTDVMASCVAGTPSNCSTLFSNASGAGNTFDAVLNIVSNPTKNVSSVWGLIPASPPFPLPAGTTMPASLFLSLNYTSSILASASVPTGIAVDPSGDVWVANFSNNTVTELPNNVTFSGSFFSGPTAIATDKAGNVWVANGGGTGTSSVTKILPGAPADCSSGCTSFSGAGISSPAGITVDNSGNVWVANAEQHSSSVTKIPSGAATCSACQNFLNPTSGTVYFSSPVGITADASGNIWVANIGNASVTKIASAAAPDCSSGCTSFSGTGTGVGIVAPIGVAADSAGNVWVTNTTVAYNPFNSSSVTEIPTGTTSCSSASACPTFTGAGINGPTGIAADASGNIWVANANGNSVTEIPVNATSCASGCVNFTAGGLIGPTGIALDGSGNVWVADTAGVTRIPSGATTCSSCTNLRGGGTGGPVGVAVNVGGDVWVALASANTVATIQNAGSAYCSSNCGSSSGSGTGTGSSGSGSSGSGTFGGSNFNSGGFDSFSNFSDFSNFGGCSSSNCNVSSGGSSSGANSGSSTSGGGLCYTACGSYTLLDISSYCASGCGTFSRPAAVAIDASNNLWIANAGGGVLEIADPNNPSNCQNFNSGGATGCNSTFTTGINVPVALAVDGAGNVWVANSGNNSVTEIPKGASDCSSCTNFTGGGISGPAGIATDSSGNIWVTNGVGNSVTEIPKGAANCTGTACPTFTGAGINGPAGIAADANGNIWIANGGNNSVTKIPKGASDCSSCTNFTGGGISAPTGIAVDGAGNVWVADSGNNSVTEISSGSATCATGCFTVTSGSVNLPSAIAVDPSGNVWVGNSGANSVTEVVGAAVPVKTPVIGAPSQP